MKTIMNVLNEIKLKYTGLQRNKALWDYYEENSETFVFEDILLIRRELSRYRYIHEYSDLLVSDSMLCYYFNKEKERFSPMKAFEILFLVTDGTKRNELLIDYVYSYPGEFSQKEKNAIQDFIYPANVEDEFNGEFTRKKILERV